MYFINEVNTLNVDIIIRCFGHSIVTEFLDIDYIHHQPAGKCLLTGALNVFRKLRPRANLHHVQPTGTEFVCRLLHQVKTVYDEIKLRYNLLSRIIIRKDFDIVKSQFCLATALRMPDYTATGLTLLTQLLRFMLWQVGYHLPVIIHAFIHVADFSC